MGTKNKTSKDNFNPASCETNVIRRFFEDTQDFNQFMIVFFY